MQYSFRRHETGWNTHTMPGSRPVGASENSQIQLFRAALVAAILFLTGSVSFAAGQGLDAVADPKAAQPLVLKNRDGDPYDLSQSHGRVVLVNFWAVWCTPCRAEMPSMQRLYQQFDNQDFEIVAVDMGSSRKHIDAFLAEMTPSLEFKIVLDETGETAAAWGVRGIPVSYIIDRQGNLAYKAIGERDWSSPQIKSTLQTLIDQP